MRKLYRSRYDKKIAGVCGGLGNYFSIDPVLFRLLLIFLVVPTAIVFVPLFYLLAAWIIPLEPPNTPAIEFRRLYRASNDRFLAGICGGLAKISKVDATVLRLILLVVTILTGVAPVLITYLIAWVIIPEKNL